MSTSILATKLYAPPPRPNLVIRQHLIERLNAGLHRKLTLVSAPAGFGKTTLVSEWLARCECPTAWLSLDEGDNDPARFLTYFVTAIQTIAPTVGQGMLGMLQSPQPPPTEAILTALLNELSSKSRKFVFVLDDYHVLDSTPVDLALTFLLEHLPSQLHLVITTRDDPQLPVARLRARGQLTELRAADLRFSSSEAAQFLNQVMRLNLSEVDIATLGARTEGWIAGLQLAALSVQGHQDVSAFIRAFAGDNHYIVDYLVDEVLQRQPEPVRRFLLQTAILDRLNGSLCDAVTGQADGSGRLEALERGNFFVVPLDDKRRWYRYHQLFADVLKAHLMAEQPDQVATLHQRASEWYEHHDSVTDAIRYALAARDFERAARLVELAVPAMRQSRQEATVLGWLKALPDVVIRARPVLSVHYAGTLLINGTIEGVEARLQDGERWLDTTADRATRPAAPEAKMVVVDVEEFHALAGAIALYRAAIALASGDVANTTLHAYRVLKVAPVDDHLRHGGAAGFLGLACWTGGDLEGAQRWYTECMARLLKVGFVSDAIGCCITMADIQIAQGRLREAMRTYERGLQLATEPDVPVLRGAADMHVGMSEIYLERNELDAAAQHLLRSKELGEINGLPQNRHRWRIAMARIREAEDDPDGALDLLDEAERLYVSDFSPNVRPVGAMKTRLWVAQGRLSEALRWAQEQRLSVEDALSYLREFEHITLARTLLGQHKRDSKDRSLKELMGLLDRLLQAAEEGNRTRSVIEILVLQSLAHQAQGDIAAALTPLERSLTLAEPEGYIRMFVDEGAPMVTLLEKAAKHGIARNYIGQLLKAFGNAEHTLPVTQDLNEPLSERELQVLRLLGTDLDGPQLARELIVSLNTLRTHTKNIYTKLGVNNRRAAVRRAEALNLL